MRVIAYVDGFNLYHGLREKGWRWAYWLNIPILAHLFLKLKQSLVQTKYFTSIVSDPPDKHVRQATFLEALKLSLISKSIMAIFWQKPENAGAAATSTHTIPKRRPM